MNKENAKEKKQKIKEKENISFESRSFEGIMMNVIMWKGTFLCSLPEIFYT
jgi:hypothetical protein